MKIARSIFFLLPQLLVATTTFVVAFAPGEVWKNKRPLGADSGISTGPRMKAGSATGDQTEDVSVPYDAAARLAYEEWRARFRKGGGFDADRYHNFKNNYEAITANNVAAKKKARDEGKDEPDFYQRLNEYGDFSPEEYYKAAQVQAAVEGSPKSTAGKAADAAVVVASEASQSASKEDAKPVSPAKEEKKILATDDDDADSLKTQLLEKIAAVNRLQDEDGKIAVDFGVKGGEIDEKSRAPRKLDFYTVSERVGKAADEIFDTIERLSRVNPTAAATAGFGNKAATTGDSHAPLDGTWRLLFSTAADASFSRDSKRGDARAMNIVDAKRGRITNVIKFAPKEDGKPKAVEELRVKLAAKAEGPNRIDLVFKYVAVKCTKLFFFPLRWTLYIPVPGPAVGKFVIAIRNLKNRLLRQKKEPAKLPKAFFDVLYLDNDLRVHKTGENNYFVQARPEWQTAWDTVGV